MTNFYRPRFEKKPLVTQHEIIQQQITLKECLKETKRRLEGIYFGIPNNKD